MWTEFGMAEKTNPDKSLIMLSSSDDDQDHSNDSLKAKTLKSVGLQQTLPDKSTCSSMPSTSKSDLNKNGSVTPTSDELFQTFVSSLYPLLKKGDIPIVNKVLVMKSLCKETYIHSEEFRNRLRCAIDNCSQSPKNVFVYIKDVYDDMKANREKETQNGNEEDKPETCLKSEEEVNERHIRKLEKYLGKLDRKIRKLKAKDISLDEMDSSNSAYIYEDRLVKRFIKIWEKLCELKKRSSRVSNHVNKKFKYSGSRYPEMNSQVEKFMNSCKIVPDYLDILKVCRTANESSSLGLAEPVLQLEAENIFKDVVQELKCRRIKDHIDLSGCYLTDDLPDNSDPADADPDLKQQLDKSYEEGQLKEKKLFAEFTAKQVEQNLVPKEVPDDAVAKDEPGSPENTDDEEEDRLIESQQIEDEEYSDDEKKIKRYLDEPEPQLETDARSPSVILTSDEEPDENQELDSCAADVMQVAAESPSSTPKRSAESESTKPGRSCMARLKITLPRSLQNNTHKDFTEAEAAPEEFSAPPTKRHCSETFSDEDIIVLD